MLPPNGHPLFRPNGATPGLQVRHPRGFQSPGPVASALLADWPPDKLKEARKSGSLLDAREVAEVVLFMLTRPRGMTLRDVVMMPTNFDL